MYEMPYLHWETDRGRLKLEKTVRDVTAEQKGFKPLHTFTDVVEAKVKASKSRPLAIAISNRRAACRMIMPSTILGQVLFRAALLFEAIDDYFDQILVSENLYKCPPLHPRRTLDQTQYWTLRTRKKRHRDQVVYRGTAPQQEFMHHHNCRRGFRCNDQRHCNWDREGPCNQCQHDICKIARVIMVDQLWLWILDGSKRPRSFTYQKLHLAQQRVSSVGFPCVVIPRTWPSYFLLSRGTYLER
jgi:hypothetical protein